MSLHPTPTNMVQKIQTIATFMNSTVFIHNVCNLHPMQIHPSGILKNL